LAETKKKASQIKDSRRLTK